MINERKRPIVFDYVGHDAGGGSKVFLRRRGGARSAEALRAVRVGRCRVEMWRLRPDNPRLLLRRRCVTRTRRGKQL